MNMVILKPSDEQHKINPISCPFCDGLSLRLNLKGKYYYGPIGKEESVYPTIIEKIDFLGKEENILLWDIIIKKG